MASNEVHAPQSLMRLGRIWLMGTGAAARVAVDEPRHGGSPTRLISAWKRGFAAILGLLL